MGRFIGVLLTFAGFVLFVGWCTTPSTASRARAAERAIADADVIARVMCHRAVRQRLRSPSTADFGGFDATRITPVAGRPGHWVLSGQVTAVNAFNAPITTTWVCDANTNDSTATASLAE